MFRRGTFALVIALTGFGCGSSKSGGDIDAAPPASDGAPVLDPDANLYESCGDSLVTGTEQCDDGNDSNDDECKNDCTFACGDGEVNAIEACDTGISAGEAGACPSECTAPDACTNSVLSGDNCQATCVDTAITAYVDGDGCCPADGNNNLDDDCPVTCGNSAVEMGESCDTAIAAGMTGACPVAADCVDGMACTSDVLNNGGTCTAACDNPEITAPADDDGCCPTGATSATDNDCSAACGNGVVEAGETCDTGIAAGMTGACPVAADCVDGMVCTRDLLLSAGTCSATCSNPAITMTDDGTDGCCPPGADATTDDNCTPDCGNGVVEPGEECDDGNEMSGDGCSDMCMTEVLPTAFRFTSLALRDPHAYTLVFGLFCTDITTNLNDEFAAAITMDGDDPPDGFLDLSVLNIFRPLAQMAATTPMEIVIADCTAPAGSTTCAPQPDGDAPIMSTATNMSSGTCLGTIAGTTGGYSPAITTATGPCYSSDAETLTLNIGDLSITLTDARIGATYVGAPATSLVNGLVRGFISEADADATILPDDLPIVGGQPLSSLFPGGSGNCRSDDQRDTGPGGVTGWYLYLNFQATVVPWTGG